jgi:hypothetical protein
VLVQDGRAAFSTSRISLWHGHYFPRAITGK